MQERAAHALSSGEQLEDRFETLKQEDQVEALLQELMAKQPRLES